MGKRRASAEPEKGALQRAARFLCLESFEFKRDRQNIAGDSDCFARSCYRFLCTEPHLMQNLPVWPSLHKKVIKKLKTARMVCFCNRLEFQGDFHLELTHDTKGCFSTNLHLHKVLKQTDAILSGKILVIHLHTV